MVFNRHLYSRSASPFTKSTFVLLMVAIGLVVVEFTGQNTFSKNRDRVLSDVLDPKTLQLKSEFESGILDDGTFLMKSAKLDCQHIVDNSDRIKRFHWHHHESCKRFDSQFGNRLGTLYGVKMIADTLKKPFYFTCDAEEGETANGAAYLMNLNTLNKSGPPPIKDGEEITTANICSLCAPFQSCLWFSDSLSAGADGMRQDWSYLTNSDFVPIDDLDDVAIHLRLGDALYSVKEGDKNKGVFPIKLYINLIEQAQQEKGPIGSIGIVTAPFKGGLKREWDFGMEDLGEKIVLSLTQALQIAFPDAKVNIRNSPEQTIMESLARLVNAPKAAVCGCSTFCAQALLATKGIGFLYLPNEHSHTNRWVRSLNTSKYENIRLFEAPRLTNLVMDNRVTGEKLSDESVLFWMQHQELDVGGIDITERNHTSFLVDTVS